MSQPRRRAPHGSLLPLPRACHLVRMTAPCNPISKLRPQIHIPLCHSIALLFYNTRFIHSNRRTSWIPKGCSLERAWVRMVAGTDRAPRTRLLRGFNGGRREDGWTTEMRCRMRNEEELFGGGGQSLTILLRNHHIKAHDVLTWRESPVQSGASHSHATRPPHNHHPWISQPQELGR